MSMAVSSGRIRRHINRHDRGDLCDADSRVRACERAGVSGSPPRRPHRPCAGGESDRPGLRMPTMLLSLDCARSEPCASLAQSRLGLCGDTQVAAVPDWNDEGKSEICVWQFSLVRIVFSGQIAVSFAYGRNNIPGKGAAIPARCSDSAMRSIDDQSVRAAASIPLPHSGFKKLVARLVQIRPKSGPRCTCVPERPLFGRRWADIAVSLFERNARCHTPSLAHSRCRGAGTDQRHRRLRLRAGLRL
jgi:hypothetical protein